MKKRVRQGKKRADSNARNVTTAECGEALSLPVDLIRDYVARGCPHAKGKLFESHRFDPSEVAAWMKANNLTGKPGRPVETSSAGLEEVRIRKETAMAVNWEYRNSQLEGELVNKEEYRRHWIGEVQTIKNKCRGLGASVAPGCVGMDAGEIQGLIDQRVEQIFGELSE